MGRPSNFVPRATAIPVAPEDELQEQCVYWFKVQYPKYARLIHHSPNEAAYKQAGRARNLGMQVGFPDIFIAVPRGRYHGLFIEKKTLRKGSKPTPEEDEMLNLLAGQGYFAAVTKTLLTFMQVVNRYMSLKVGEEY